jgi:hypothetical protein
MMMPLNFLEVSIMKYKLVNGVIVCAFCGVVIGSASFGTEWAHGPGCPLHVGCEYRHQEDVPAHGGDHNRPANFDNVVVATSTSASTGAVFTKLPYNGS